MKAPKKYLNRRKVNIDYILEKPRRNFTSGTFHKLRLELKKLNSFLDLINFCSKDFKRTKTYKPFKQVFRQAGKIRELQIQEAMLKEYFSKSSLGGYKKILRKSRLEEKRQFFSMIDTKMVNRIQSKFDKIGCFLHHIKSKTATSYLDKKIETIKNLINQSPLQMERLHELRKLLKSLNYNRGSLALKGYDNPISKKDSLSELLGKWHDLEVMIKHLKNGLNSGEISPSEVIQLEKLKSKISVESELLFDQISRAIPNSEFFESGN